MQKPCASIRSGGLNLLRKFSIAIAAVSSTTWASVKRSRSRAKNASSTDCPVVVMRSAYSSARRSDSSNRVLVRQSRISASFSAPPSCSVARTELMSIQKGQPLIVATRT
jgi:hypothetical protein